MTPMTPNDNDNDNDNDNIIPINSLKENDPLLLDKNHSINYTNNNKKNGTYGKPSISSISKSNASERKESETSDESERNKKSREYNYKIFKYLDNYFEITARDSTIMREIRGGTVGFLTLAYIVLLNPQVLNVSGIPYEYAASSTCLASCIATLICGIFGNIPVGCGPGVGLSAYFSYGMIPQIISNNTPQFQPYLQGLFMAFLSGAIVFILTLPGIVTSIVNALPHFIKVATIVGMGLFLAFVGMVDVGLVKQSTGQGNAILELGDMSSWIIWLSLLNTLLIATLKYFKINGSLLVCIIVTSIIYFGISEKWPTKIIDFPKFMDPLSVLNFESISHLPIQTAFQSIISFVLILFLDVSGVTFAIAKLCGLAEQKETLISFQKSAFIGTSIGSMIAALLGNDYIYVYPCT